MLRVSSLPIKSLGVLSRPRFQLRARRSATGNSFEDPIDEAAAAARREARFEQSKDATRVNFQLRDGHCFL